MASKAVVLRGLPEYDEQDTASEAITPGHLIQMSSGQWRKHANAGLNAAAIFAAERDELGNDMDVAYASGDRVKAVFPYKGCRINALIASGQNLTKGTYLESAGNGTLRALATDAATDDTQRVSVVAMSAEDSGAVTVTTRHKVIIV